MKRNRLLKLSFPVALLFGACMSADGTGSGTEDPSSSSDSSFDNTATYFAAPEGVASQAEALTEAPAAFDNLTNGFVAQADFDSASDGFRDQEGIADGLGPVYNAQSCGECHQNPVTGGNSQIT